MDGDRRRKTMISDRFYDRVCVQTLSALMGSESKTPADPSHADASRKVADLQSVASGAQVVESRTRAELLSLRRTFLVDRNVSATVKHFSKHRAVQESEIIVRRLLDSQGQTCEPTSLLPDLMSAKRRPSTSAAVHATFASSSGCDSEEFPGRRMLSPPVAPTSPITAIEEEMHVAALIREQVKHDSTVKDFSCVAFTETTYQMLLSALESCRSVQTLILQMVSVPFGAEGKLLRLIEKNPTPICDVELHGSSFRAYPKLCDDIEAALERNRSVADATRMRHTQTSLRLKRLLVSEADERQRRQLSDHAASIRGAIVKEEYVNRRKLLEAWHVVYSHTKQRDYDRRIAIKKREGRRQFFTEESTLRLAIRSSEHHSFLRLLDDDWVMSRGAIELEESERRRAAWSAYCASWTYSSVCTRRRSETLIVLQREIDVHSQETRSEVAEEEGQARLAIHIASQRSLDAIASARQEARVRKDDEYRRVRQRQQEEDIALEQQRAKAKMESMLHNSPDDLKNGGGGPGGSLPKGKVFKLGDEDIFRRQMEEWNTQIFLAFATIKKLTERCVDREAKIRESITKYQKTFGITPRFSSRVSSDAPPSVLYDGQQHPLELEPTLSLHLAMDSFWAVRCEILRDEIVKQMQPYKQSRKECAQQLYGLLQDVERIYRFAGLPQQLAWPVQLKAAYFSNANAPSKELFEFVDKLLLQSVKKVKHGKETIFCGELVMELLPEFEAYGGLALDETALLAFRDQKPQLYHCSKPISMWSVFSEGERHDLPVPSAMKVDPVILMERTIDANVVREEPPDDPAPPTGHRSAQASSRGPKTPKVSARVAAAPSPNELLTSSSFRLVPSSSNKPLGRKSSVSAPRHAEDDKLTEITLACPTDASISALDASRSAASGVSLLCGDDDDASDKLEMPSRPQYAARRLLITIPTGVTPEQVEALAKCCKFVPAAELSELLNFEARIVSVKMTLRLFTKGYRQRHLPLTNLTLNANKPLAVLRPPSGNKGTGSPTRFTAPGTKSVSAAGSPSLPRPATPGKVPQLQLHDTVTNAAGKGESSTSVKRLNPLKSLSIVTNSLELTISFVLTPRVLTVQQPKIEASHDARAGACRLFPHQAVALCRPPDVCRSKKNPFQLLLRKDEMSKGDAASLSSGAPSADVSQQSLALFCPPATTVTAQPAGESLPGGITYGDAPFRGLKVFVTLTQYSKLSAEDVATVESDGSIVARDGQVYFVDPHAARNTLTKVSHSHPSETPQHVSLPHARDAFGSSLTDLPEDARGRFMSLPHDPFLNMQPLVFFSSAAIDGRQGSIEDTTRLNSLLSSNTATTAERRSGSEEQGADLQQLCVGEQVATYELLPQELKVEFGSDDWVTKDVVERVLGLLSYRNVSVDPTTGVRILQIRLVSEANIEVGMEAHVHVTANDDPTDWDVHQPNRVLYFPLDAAHGQQWLQHLQQQMPSCEEDLSNRDRVVEAMKQLDSLCPPNILRFADSVEVLDDDTTFFSAGHLRFKLYHNQEGVEAGVCPEGEDMETTIKECASASSFKLLRRHGRLCEDDGVGIFLDLPTCRTPFGMCLVQLASAPAQDDRLSGASGSFSSSPSASLHHAPPAGGDVFELYDDGYLQGVVFCSAATFGSIDRGFVTATMTSSTSLSTKPLVDPLEPQSDDPLQLGAGEGALTATGTVHRTVHKLYNEIHIEFAKGGNGATVDTVQDLTRYISFVNMKRYPVVPTDLAPRLVTVDMLVGATTGRRDILGELLPDTNVNQPLHAVIAIESRPSLFKPPSRSMFAPQSAIVYPENSGPLFLFDDVMQIPRSFVGGYLKAELLEDFRESSDRVDCVDRQEAIAFQERELDEHRAKMAAGKEGGPLKPSPRAAAGAVTPPASGPLTFESLTSCLMTSVATGDGIDPDTASITSSPMTGLHSQSAASLMRRPSAYASFRTASKYAAVRLAQNPIATAFEESHHSAAATVAPSSRSLVAYTMREFAKVNMLSSTAETVAAASTGVTPTVSSGSMGRGAVHSSGASLTNSNGNSATATPVASIRVHGNPRFSFLPTRASFAGSSLDDSSGSNNNSTTQTHEGISKKTSTDKVAPLAMLGSEVFAQQTTLYSSLTLTSPPVVPQTTLHGAAGGGGGALTSRSRSVAFHNDESLELPSVSALESTVKPHMHPADNDAAASTPHADENNNHDIISPMRRRASRTRSVIFNRSQLDAAADSPSSPFSDKEILHRSSVVPVLQSSLLAISSKRRTSMCRYSRGVSGDSTMSDGQASVVKRKSSTSGVKRRMSAVGRSAQELVWANRLKKILCERADGFLFLLNKSCTKLLQDRQEHLEYLGLTTQFVDDDEPRQPVEALESGDGILVTAADSTSPRSGLTVTIPVEHIAAATPVASSYARRFSTATCSERQYDPKVSFHSISTRNAEVATSICHRQSGNLVIIFEPSTVITPSVFASVVRSVCFESRSRCTIHTLRVLRLTLRMYDEGICSLLVPISVVPYDDPTELTLHMPALRYRHLATSITPLARQSIGGAKGLSAAAAALRSGKTAASAAKKGGAPAVVGLAVPLGSLPSSSPLGSPLAVPASKEGYGVLRLFPKEHCALFDPDTSHWDGGFVEVTIDSGATRGDCLCILSPEQQKTLKQIFSGGPQRSARGAGVTPRSVSDQPLTPGPSSQRNLEQTGLQQQAQQLSSSLLGASDADVSVFTPNRRKEQAAPTDAVPPSDWILIADPPFPSVASSPIDPSQHAAVEANDSVHVRVMNVLRTLHVAAPDGTILIRNIGTAYVGAVGQPLQLLDVSNSNSNTQLSTQLDVSNAAAALEKQLLEDPYKVHLRVDFSVPSGDDPYARCVSMDVLRLVVFNVGYFNTAPLLDATSATKTACIAIKDADTPEEPSIQNVQIEFLPSFFNKPPALCEPILYSQRAAMEGRFEFLFQKLRTSLATSDKDRMPLCTIEVFPVSGWLPRDTMTLRLSGTQYVLTQDGQVISGKELVARHTTATSTMIHLEITKDCRGATWQKVVGLLALISYHFDMKDIGKDAPAPAEAKSSAAAMGQSVMGQSVVAPAASPNALPQHDRVVGLQVTEVGAKDIEGRQEYWSLLQRISYSYGITSEQ